MKYILISVASIALLVFSCSTTSKDQKTLNTMEITYPADNLNNDTYTPGEDWKLTWSDEFNEGSIDLTNWSFQEEPAGRFNQEWQRYTNSSKNGYIDSNCLVIKAVHESNQHGMDQYTSARLNTANKQTFKYGKIASRIQLPYGKGIWPAFWLLGANINENGGDTPWPACGEIDILELYGSKDNAAVEVNMHYSRKSGNHGSMGAKTYTLDSGIFAESFHVFELEWNRKYLKWYVDGKKVAQKKISAEQFTEFQKEYFLLLNIAVGGEWAGRPDDTSPFPQYMYVDWVRVYQAIDDKEAEVSTDEIEVGSLFGEMDGLIGSWHADAAIAGVELNLTFGKDGSFKQDMGAVQGEGTWEVLDDEHIKIVTQNTTGQKCKITNLTANGVGLCWNPDAVEPKIIPLQRVK